MEEKTIEKKGDTLNKNQSKQTIIILSVIIVIAVVIGVYFLLFKKDDGNKGTANPTPTATSTENYVDWVDYLLKQNITEMELSELSCENQENLTLETDWNTKNLTIDEVKEILNKLVDIKLSKKYEPDLGVPICGKNLVINYTKNNIEYSFILEENRIRGPEDKELINLFEKINMNINKLEACSSEDDCMFAYTFESNW